MHILTIAASLIFSAISPIDTEAVSAQPRHRPPLQQQTEAKPSAEPSGIDPAKEADIRKLMDLTGAKALAAQTMNGMEKSIKPLMAGSLPPGDYRDKLIDAFFAKFHTHLDTQHLIDMAVPIYDKYFSHEEIKGLIAFYGTPLGQKTLGVLPQLMGELQAAGRQWGEGLGRRCMSEVLAENPELAQGLLAAQKNSTPQ